jgi:hypothetical protein
VLFVMMIRFFGFSLVLEDKEAIRRVAEPKRGDGERVNGANPSLLGAFLDRMSHIVLPHTHAHTPRRDIGP